MSAEMREFELVLKHLRKMTTGDGHVALLTSDNIYEKEKSDP